MEFKDFLKKFVSFLKPYNFDWDSEEHVNNLIEKFLLQLIDGVIPISDGFFPPPWNINEYPEKTEGWIEFQKAIKKDPIFYSFQPERLNPEDAQDTRPLAQSLRIKEDELIRDMLNVCDSLNSENK